ncbi:MAG: hypothetical protein U5R06_04585 [candidate division KSB1 bacterium]|nr:hypothetical protein [candidate division KSB1 bacterium]
MKHHRNPFSPGAESGAEAKTGGSIENDSRGDSQNVLTVEKGTTDGEKRYYRILPPEGEDFGVRDELNGKRFYFGKVLYVENGVVLIQWNKDVDPDRLQGKEVTIFRKQSADRIVPLTRMNILNSRGSRTAAANRAYSGNVRAGDLAGILLKR